VTASDIRRTIDAVWRLESARLVAGLARIVRDVGVAEDLAHDALVAALQQWPAEGMPRNPGAWLMAAAKHRAIDYVRRRQLLQRKHGELAYETGAHADPTAALDASLDDEVGDDMLRLIFIACHPVLPRDARLALTLRLVGGLTTDEIARAFLVPEPTIAQRIVRAKRTLADKRVPYEMPHGAALGERLSSVLEVIYLVFNEGYTATAGDHWVRAALCEEALRLARMLAALAPGEPEASGLAALLEIQASRLRARVDPDGNPVLLLDQNRGLWDQLLIGRGLAALERAEALGGRRGPYTLQAAIAACHGRAREARDTDWARIASLYAELAAVAPSPIVELNRAVAVAHADGPEPALAIVDRLGQDGALARYHLLPSVRGHLLQRLGRFEDARQEFERAASLTRNTRERNLLLARAEEARAIGERRR
jgi:RNA polymerase sigma factor (sigma-70 family)